MTEATGTDARPRVGDEPAELYLELLKRCLTRAAFPNPYQPIEPLRGSGKRALYHLHRPLRRLLRAGGMELVRRREFDEGRRNEGRDHPPDAETMIGVRRLDNLHDCIRRVLRDGVPGDLIETGVWRGGATIFMRGALAAYGDAERRVWVADSFQGLPKGDAARYAEDADDPFWRNAHLAVALEDVQDNFRRYGLLDERVCFVKGWFRDTLPGLDVGRLAVLRLDADMYESTIVALEALYPKVEPGGYVIVDDYGAVPTGAGKATDDFRAREGIADELVRVDWTGVYWRKSGDGAR